MFFDDGLQTMRNHVARGAIATFFSYQPGYDLIIGRPDRAGWTPRQRDWRQWMRRTAATTPQLKVEASAVGQFDQYLQSDTPIGIRNLQDLQRNTAAKATFSGRSGRSIFSGKNYKNISLVLSRIDTFAPLAGRRVLEIGASTYLDVAARILIEEYGAHYVGNNVKEFSFKMPDATFMVGDIHELNFEPASFDLIFLIGVMEHVPRPIDALRRAESWLRRSGVIYNKFQIFSGKHGHHIYTPRFPAHLIPDFAQLTMTAADMRAFLRGKVDETVTDGIIEMMYYGDEINRVGVRDYLEYFRSTSLELIWADGCTNGRMEDRASNLELIDRYDYTNEQLSCFGLEFALRKSDFTLINSTSSDLTFCLLSISCTIAGMRRRSQATPRMCRSPPATNPM